MARVVQQIMRYNQEIYTVEVEGVEVTVTATSNASVVRRWISTTLYFRRKQVYLNRLVVGLGVQWSPGGSDPPPEILQLSVGRRCIIYQLTYAEYVPKCLRAFLNNPSHTFVGFWNYSDRGKLERSEHKLLMWREPLDLRYCAKTRNGENLVDAPAEEITQKCLGYEIDRRRGVSMSVWCVRYLSHEQVAYATVDAYCAFLIGRNSRVWELQRR